ncbi:MAG: hypothetical protein WCP09_00705 [Candidatus Taylorbacteria bacterium]
MYKTSEHTWRQKRYARIRVRMFGYETIDGNTGNGIGEYMSIDNSRITTGFINDALSLPSASSYISTLHNN